MTRKDARRWRKVFRREGIATSTSIACDCVIVVPGGEHLIHDDSCWLFLHGVMHARRQEELLHRAGREAMMIARNERGRERL